MKTLILVLVSLFLGELEKPASIPSRITELKSNNWYAEKAEEWRIYLNSNEAEDTSWLQYLLATKYAGNSQDVELITSQIGKQFPQSFISHYATFQLKGWTAEGIESLQAALELDNSRAVTFEDQLIYAELKGRSDRMMRSKKLYESGLIHSSTLNYNYNLLMSVNEGGLLITDGLHTTIPIWILQDVMNVRKDVSVLNLELARTQPEYLDRILAKNNLRSSVEELLSEEQGQNIFYALTLPRTHLEKLENRLYVVGLASTSGMDDFNHFEVLRRNIEDKFLMDYLTIDFNGEPKTATGNVLSSNYIVPLLLLKEFYDNLNESEKSNSLKQQILDLAEDSQIKTRVALLLNETKAPTTFKIVELDVKTLDKHMKQVKNSLYASEIELSNREFWFYMEYLRNNGYEELYKLGLVDLSEYDEVTKALLRNYHYSPANAQMNEKQRPGGSYFDYPVMDLTYEVATAYCEWLTVQYNAQQKRKFKKVEFRLPSKEEWVMAALGVKDFQSWNLKENEVTAFDDFKGEKVRYSLKDETVSYPWFNGSWKHRNSITNDKDCYLANVKVPDEVLCQGGIKGDGYNFTSPVGSYFANGMGMYDVVGNVAEMIDQKGIAMGGSWNHEAEECTITSAYQYVGRDLKVGLRLFMEVIEE